MNKKIRFIDNRTNAHIREVLNTGQLNGVERGHVIYPFTTPNGLTKWRVDYLEEIDMYTTFVYITELGFVRQ